MLKKEGKRKKKKKKNPKKFPPICTDRLIIECG